MVTAVMDGSEKSADLYLFCVPTGMLDGDAVVIVDVRSVDDVVFLGSVS